METQKTSPSPFLTLPARSESEARLEKFRTDGERALAEFKAKQEAALRNFRRDQILRQGGIDAMEWAKNLFAIGGRRL